MYIQAGVTLQFVPSRSYEFISKVQWPSDNCETAVREGVEEVLRERHGNLNSIRVTLTKVEWDEISSSRLAFRNAAKAATRAAFEV